MAAKQMGVSAVGTAAHSHILRGARISARTGASSLIKPHSSFNFAQGSRFITTNFPRTSGGCIGMSLSKLRSCSNRTMVVVSGATASATQATSSGYLAEGKNFQSLGLSPELSTALANCGFATPTTVQAYAVPQVIKGKTVVLAAETGSGKTLAYLAPFAQAVLNRKAEIAATQPEQDARSRRWPSAEVVVLCPNAQLCKQVTSMADQLLGADGEKLFTTHHLTAQTGLYKVSTDLLVTTPVGLLNEILQSGVPNYRREIFFRSIRHVVLDEADMLMTGGFQRPMQHLIQLLKRWQPEQTLFVKDSAATPSGLLVPKNEQAEAPWGAAAEQGDVEENGADTPTKESANDEARDPELEEVPGVWASLGGETAQDLSYKKRQFLFVGATIPQNGKKTVGAILKQWYPNATWVEGNKLHCTVPTVTHRFMPVTEANKKEALVEAVLGGAGAKRTMVFCNSTGAADAIADLISSAGGLAKCYHRGIHDTDKQANLEEFRDGSLPVLVCTDAAARGIDIPEVEHVVQAEFVPGAVDFLHRVGRTGRAGRAGRVTSMYTEEMTDLVQAMQGNVEKGLPVEDAFSRNRMFRKKLKKYGPSRRGVSNRS